MNYSIMFFLQYTEALVILKFLFQFQFFPWNSDVVQVNMEDVNPFYPVRIIGLDKRPYYAAYDIALLMVLFYHRYILRVRQT